MFRVHQFNKVELFVFVPARDSWDEHERLLELEEALLQALGLPYRVVDVAAGDLGASAAKKYDIEAWFPAQGRYREVTSCSNTTDYQARRLGIRYRGERGPEPRTRSTARWSPTARCSRCSRTSGARCRRCCTRSARRSGRRLVSVRCRYGADEPGSEHRPSIAEAPRLRRRRPTAISAAQSTGAGAADRLAGWRTSLGHAGRARVDRFAPEVLRRRAWP